MITIQGKYNTATIFTDDIEEAAYKQVLNLMDEIIRNINATAEIIKNIKPIYNFKATE